MPSIREIAESWRESKAPSEKVFPWYYYVIRPVSFPITKVLWQMGISPNFMTFLGLLLGWSSLLLLGGGTTTSLILGSLLFNLYTLTDCVDGNLARLKPSRVPVGRFFDSLVSLLVEPFLFLALGIGLWNAGMRIPYFLVEVTGVGREALWIGIGSGATVGKLVMASSHNSFYGVLGPCWERRAGGRGQSVQQGSWYRAVYLNLTYEQSLAPLLLLAAVAELVGPFLLIVGALVMSESLAWVLLFVRRAYLLQKLQ